MKKIIQNQFLVKLLFALLIIISLSGLISSPTALIGGFLFAHFFGHPFLNLNGKAVSWLLKIAVVGLGFGMNLTETVAADRKSTRLNSSHVRISYAVFCLKKKKLTGSRCFISN